MTLHIEKAETWGHAYMTTYCGTQSEIIAARIVPPDFFNFRGPCRTCSRDWWGKKTPSEHPFPAGVSHISARKVGGVWHVGITHETDAPPFVPPGETWQRPEPKPEPSAVDDLKRVQNFYRFHRLDDTDRASPRIGTGCVHVTQNNTFTVSFSGTREQLINTGVATAAMFPAGTTPTGRARTYKDRESARRWRGMSVNTATAGTFSFMVSVKAALRINAQGQRVSHSRVGP